MWLQSVCPISICLLYLLQETRSEPGTRGYNRGTVTAYNESRIVGGTATSIEVYPFAAQILHRSSVTASWYQVCGGTIITTYHVVSAAHCFLDMQSSTEYVAVRVGTSYSTGSGGVVHTIDVINNHPSYDNPPYSNDISVLKLTDALTFSTTIQAVILPIQGYQVDDNEPLDIIGWGHIAVGGPSSGILLDATVNKVNLQECQSRYESLQVATNTLYPVYETNLCSGLLDVGGVDACQGDSGGPVLYGDILVGITSWGEGCAHATYPGVNTKVSSFTTWILTVVEQTDGDNSGPVAASTTTQGPMLMLFIITVCVCVCVKYSVLVY